MHKVSLNWKTTKIRYCAQTFDKYCITVLEGYWSNLS